MGNENLNTPHNPPLQQTAVISRANDYCITHPPLMRVGDFGFTYNLDAYCGCRKPYKEHEYWQKWMSEHGL